MTPLKLGEFFLAYFVGALKVTFLDAYLGSMLTSAALATDDVAASTKVRDWRTLALHTPPLPSHIAAHILTRPPLSPDPQGVVVVETLFIVIVSVLITQFATGLFAEMMAAEGFEVAGAAAGAGGGGEEEAASDDAAAAGASEEGEGGIGTDR